MSCTLSITVNARSVLCSNRIMSKKSQLLLLQENRFDPERRSSSLVSAFTGTSNMQQRAGRAGRHRSGEYFSLVSEQRLKALPAHQTVEIKRLDLSNVSVRTCRLQLDKSNIYFSVMQVKGLKVPLDVENVLAACIEPPDRRRVLDATHSLQLLGVLDQNKNLTSLGQILLRLPVDAGIGKLCLLGCFFRCLGPSIDLI